MEVFSGTPAVAPLKSSTFRYSSTKVFISYRVLLSRWILSPPVLYSSAKYQEPFPLAPDIQKVAPP